MSQRLPREETLYFVPGRFSADSGGRTRSVMHRAAVLAPYYRGCAVVTLNDRADYGAVFEAWRTAFRLPVNVTHLNFYAYLAGEPLHDPEPPVRFEPGPDLRLSKDGRSWVRVEDGVLLERYFANEDGSLGHSKAYRDGAVVERSGYDARGRVRVRALHDPAAAGPHLVERLTPTGRVFVLEEVSGRQRRLRVDGGPLDTLGEFVPEFDLHRAWFRELNGAVVAPVFLLEDHRHDHLVVDNPLMPAGVRTVATVHSNHLRPGTDDVHDMKRYAKGVLSRLDTFSATVVLTRQQKADIEAVYGPRPTLVRIPHAVSIRESGERPALRQRVRGLVRRPQRVVLVTRLHPVKRLDHVIRAFALVTQSVPTARLEIWGGGEEETSLVRLARTLGISKKVSFPGHTTSAATAYRRGMVSVSTSLTEGFGLSTAEALACGLPVVAYDYRYGPAELIRHGSNGLLVPDGDIDALAAGLVELLSSRPGAALMGLRGRLVRRTYSARKHRARWLAVIDGTRSSGATARTGHD